MSYLVFARKFRPQNFDSVVGQEPIITTLKNAIKQERIPQNFLFAGPRGCGKTSTARILAKALNCAKGPTENPCGKCTGCIEITEGNSMDVLEIDGASNRGIDEIRNLRDTVKFKPVNGRMKIYIIDEVHMLTTEAFNALLKTLEEPPAHVKFIFATTEPHKVPLTILSRCHRFNFKRIPVQEIAGKLEEIAKAEKIKYEKNVLFLIAKTSDGALRDAEGMLDQLASFSGSTIKEEDVLLMLGLASEEIYFSVLSALKAKDAKKIFTIVEDLYKSGRDIVQFSKGLLEIFRHLLLLQCSDETGEFIEMSDDALAELKKRKNDFTRDELLLALSFLGNLQGNLRRNLAPPRLQLEIALLKLIHLEGYQSLAQLASSAPAAPAPAARASVSASAPVSAPSRPAVSNYSTPAASTPAPAAPVQAPVRNAAPSQSAAPGSLTLDEAEIAWPRVIDYVKTKRMSTGIFLSESEPVEVSDGSVTLGFPAEFQFHKDMLDKAANKQLVEEAFEVASGKKVRVQFVVTEVDNQVQAPAAPKTKTPESAAPKEPQTGKLAEIITEALSVFDGAKIVRAE